MIVSIVLATAVAAATAAPAGSSAETAVVATKADYRLWPSAYDWYLATPELVHARGLAGRAVLVCKVNDLGDLARCQVQSEEPKGFGFGKAAMTLRGKVKMVPPPRGVERWVLVPFRWDKDGPYLPPTCC